MPAHNSLLPAPLLLVVGREMGGLELLLTLQEEATTGREGGREGGSEY